MPAAKAMKPLPLSGIQHISLCVRDVSRSAAWWSELLGFSEIKRPESLERAFEGCWLFGYGLGIHLIQGEPVARPDKINPRGDHLSFQADDLDAVQEQLDELGIPWVRETVVEGGVLVTQIFLHDPDNNMVEICNCGLLPVVPVPPQVGKSNKRSSSIDMGSHARAAAAAKLLSAPASAPVFEQRPQSSARVAACGPGGCFPVGDPLRGGRPPVVFGGGAPTTTAISADCTSSVAVVAPSLTPHGGVLLRASNDGAGGAGAKADASVAGRSPHLPRPRSRTSLSLTAAAAAAGIGGRGARPAADEDSAGGGASGGGCFAASAPSASFSSPAAEKNKKGASSNSDDEATMLDAVSSPSSARPVMISVAAGNGNGGGGGNEG